MCIWAVLMWQECLCKLPELHQNCLFSLSGTNIVAWQSFQTMRAFSYLIIELWESGPGVQSNISWVSTSTFDFEARK